MDLYHADTIQWRFSCSQHKKLATCHSCLGVAPCTIRMVMFISAGNPCFLRQKLLWRHFSRSLSMWFLSLLCRAHKQKNLVSFKAKSNFNPFSSHMWKMSPLEELVPMKKVRQNFTIGSGCTLDFLVVQWIFLSSLCTKVGGSREENSTLNVGSLCLLLRAIWPESSL